ncbi:helix-turn-helix transcriptional regulator [Thermophagus xiamenensis]|uniref:Predicted DNA-binding transcriptional regulator YafY, contains an HTH and WYL domains n=1 Tax=Thermophagus xiamenensis TaxID=385682 RepID=A0A1I1VDN3_9BACT|nr:WYL domain-containing protein [Thermophagus xiamenensis]SFD80979.1 Predicted DNA-binding transcriptional regulator YafY, contains an HTH and WYL domains [Thermophagus xiamenensis]
MGLNKKAAFRYRVIDQLLQNGYALTIDEIQKKVNEALRYEFGDEDGISRRTLYYDFKAMRQPPPVGFNAPIECRHGLYQYSRPGFSIFSHTIKEKDKKLITQALAILEQMQYIPAVRQLIALLKDLSGTNLPQKGSVKKRLQFEHQNIATGIEKMDIIQYAVDHQQPLSIIYLPFNEASPLDMELHPYLIKEYRNRWYVIGWEKFAGKIYHLAFDRMVSAELTDAIFISPPSHFDPETWFNHVIGITIPEEIPIQKIIFNVSPDSAPYIRTKPLHPSQRLVDKLPDNSMIFSLNVIPNFELEMTLLGYAEKLKIIEPIWLKEKIKNRLTNALKQYD